MVVLEGVEGVEEVVVELYLGCGHGAAVEHGLPVGLECAQLGKGHGVYAVDRAAVAGLLKVREGAVEVCGRGCTGGCRGGCRGGLPPATRVIIRMQPTGEGQLDKPVGEQRPLDELRPHLFDFSWILTRGRCSVRQAPTLSNAQRGPLRLPVRVRVVDGRQVHSVKIWARVRG